MRIGVYVGGYEPNSGGGYTFENDVLEGVLAAIKTGIPYQISLLCPSGSVVALTERVAGQAVDVHPVGPTRFERIEAPFLREFPAVRARKRRPSPIDRAADTANADFIWFLGAGAQLTDRPYMTVVWDLQHRATPWFPEFSANGTWDQRELWHSWFLRRASVVITGTDVGRAELDRYYQIAPERIAILPHPTPQFALDAPSQSDPALVTGLGLGERPFLLYPAQFWPHKNHANLIMALDRLRSVHGLDLDLALVGSDKGNRAHIERLAARHDLSDRVRCLGFVSREALIALYRQAAALAYVSWCGPENLPPLEAFALGCPVVASRIPGAEEQLGDAALLADAGDPGAIAAALARVIQDPDCRRTLIANGHGRARRWTSREYVAGALSRIDAFAPVVRCWS
jgi:glycosyltransferase involved in cell wall biosynthesis